MPLIVLGRVICFNSTSTLAGLSYTVVIFNKQLYDRNNLFVHCYKVSLFLSNVCNFQIDMFNK